MIPYFELHSSGLANPYGGLLCLGIAVGFAVAIGLALRRKLFLWIPVAIGVVGIFGIIPAHLAYLATTGALLRSPVHDVLAVWSGYSLLGYAPTMMAAGLLLPLLGDRGRVGHYLDLTVQALAVAWAFGRLGCFSVHDHPGVPTSFPLGVCGICEGDWGSRFQTERACHDLGLYEAIAAGGIAVASAVLAGRLRPGTIAGGALAVFALARFGIGMLRPVSEPGDLLLVALLLVGGLVTVAAAQLRAPSKRPADVGDVPSAAG